MPKPVGQSGGVKKHDKAAKKKQHPHGGPPGQMKKELGLKSGAEFLKLIGKLDNQNDKAGKNQNQKLNLMA
jgi:hypothetical protein